jgi:uncharacterized membrane protein YczE
LLESRITALEAIAVPTAVLPKSNALSSPTTAVIPSNTFSSVAVDVTATFSLTFGEVNVLFVSVCVAAKPTNVSVTAGNVSAVLPEKSE